MKLTLKPNWNSARVNPFKSSPHDGLLQYDMVDVMAEGAVWGSIHIDGFCPFLHQIRNAHRIPFVVTKVEGQCFVDGINEGSNTL